MTCGTVWILWLLYSVLSDPNNINQMVFVCTWAPGTGANGLVGLRTGWYIMGCGVITGTPPIWPIWGGTWHTHTCSKLSTYWSLKCVHMCWVYVQLKQLTIPYTGTWGVVMGKAMGAGAWGTQRINIRHTWWTVHSNSWNRGCTTVQVTVDSTEQNWCVIAQWSYRQDAQTHWCCVPERVHCSVPTSYSTDDLISCVTAEQDQKLYPLCKM